MRSFLELIKRLFSSEMEHASLTIVGVGPGDPDQLTIAALNAIKNAKIIFYPTSREDKVSYSAEIVKKYIKHKKQIPLVFPMARKEYQAEEIWQIGAKKIVSYLKRNIPVVLLCLGDTSLYASSFYIKNEIKKNYPEININTLPGISSVSLAAAIGEFQLLKNGENLFVSECPDDLNEFKNLINKKSKKVLVIMKVGKRWTWVKNILKDKNILQKTLLATNIGMENQFIGAASEYKNIELPYFSLLLIRI